MQQDVLFQALAGREGAVGVITLNRPTVLNSLNHTMINAMFQQLTTWEKDPTIKAVVIVGAGERAFCAGGDLRFTYELYQQKSDKITAFFKDEYRLNSLIYHYKKPYIAFLNGITMGGGVGVSIHGSHRIATERLLFAMPETSIGLFPDVGGTYFLPRLPHHIGYYLGLTGARLQADECVAFGIAQHKMLATSYTAFITLLAETPLKQEAHQVVTALIEQFQEPIDSSPLIKESALIGSFFAKNSLEAIMQQLANASHPVLISALDTLQKKSPTSLKVTLSALQKGATSTFDECMAQEFRLVSHFLHHHDFFEGIRAIIIDKDQQPKWQPPKLAEVTEELVNTYFS